MSTWLATIQNVTSGIRETVDKVGEALDSVPINRTNFKDATPGVMEEAARGVICDEEAREREALGVAFSSVMKEMVGRMLRLVKAMKYLVQDEVVARNDVCSDEANCHAMLHAMVFHFLNQWETLLDAEAEERKAIRLEHDLHTLTSTAAKEHLLLAVEEEAASKHLAAYHLRLLSNAVQGVQDVETALRMELITASDKWFHETECEATAARYAVLEGSLKREAAIERVTIHEHKNRRRLVDKEEYSRTELAEEIGRSTIGHDCSSGLEALYDHFYDTLRFLVQRQLTQQQEWSLDLKQVITSESVQRSSIVEEEDYYTMQLAKYFVAEQTKIRSRLQRVLDDLKGLMRACQEDEEEVRREIAAGEEAEYWKYENAEKMERHSILDMRVPLQWDIDVDIDAELEEAGHIDIGVHHDLPDPEEHFAMLEQQQARALFPNADPSLLTFDTILTPNTTPGMGPAVHAALPPEIDEKELARADLMRRYTEKKAGGYSSLLAYAVLSNNYNDTVLAVEIGDCGDVFEIMMGAIHEGYTSSLRAIVHKVDLSRVTKDGATPLHVAVKRQRVGPVMVLLEAGSPVNTKDNTMSTPLHVACRVGDETLAEILHQYGADREAEDAEGKLPAACWPSSNTPAFLTSGRTYYSPVASPVPETDTLPPPISPQATIALHGYNLTVVFFSLSAAFMWFYVRG